MTLVMAISRDNIFLTSYSYVLYKSAAQGCEEANEQLLVMKDGYEIIFHWVEKQQLIEYKQLSVKHRRP